MKFSKNLAILAVSGFLSGALAHDVWVMGENSDKFRADIGFGHDFAKLEPIPQIKQKAFAPVKIIKKDGGVITLKQTGESYHYEGEKLKNGSYILTGEFMPTFLTQDGNGEWHDDDTKQSVKDAKYCLNATLLAKEV